MKLQHSILLTFTLISICSPMLAQWERTEGPSGGMVLSMQSNEEYLFAGTRNGLYRSGDEGHSWQQLGNGLPVSFTCHDFDLDHSSLLVYGSYQITPGDTSDRYRIFKSTDHGDSWQTIFLPDSVNYSSQVVIHDTLLFHASKSLLRSTDNGETWSALLTAQIAFIPHNTWRCMMGSCMW